jgi:methyl-accepting chemotaxis protein
MALFLKSLKISQKLLLSILSFSIPILMLLYFTVSGINNNINVANLEISGNILLEPLTHLLVLLPQHQTLAKIARAGDRSVLNNLATVTNLIETNFQILDRETKAVGESLQITPTGLRSAKMEQLLPATIAAQWQILRNSQTSGGQTGLEPQYQDLKQRISGLISRVGDTSNLILDPVLDSYYLMDVVLLDIPQAQQRVGEALLFIESLKSHAQITDLEKVKLEVYASLLQQTDLARIVQGISTSIRENKNFFGLVPSLEKNIPPALNFYKTALTDFTERSIQLARTAQGNIPDKNLLKQGEEVFNKGSDLWKASRQELDKIIERRVRYYQNQKFVYLGLSLIALALASFFVFKVSRDLSVRLAKVVTITREIARGNLTPDIHVDRQDEIGQLLVAVQCMVEDLSSLIRNTQESGIKVSASATQLVANTKQQEAVVIDQVRSTSDVMKSVKKISQIIENLVHRMGEVATSSEGTANFASKGKSDLVDLEASMQNMETASNNISNKLQAIKDKGENITLVATTMSKVAEQIDILSLNAAIEAEKAGGHGVGFAVVSREIRRLADQTAVAALEIEQIVQDMQLSVADGVGEIDNFVYTVSYSVANISKISTEFSKIIEQVQALSPNFEGVNIAMQNQSENANQINESMLSLETGMQQIENSLAQTYTTVDRLNDEAIGLQERVSKFQVNPELH